MANNKSNLKVVPIPEEVLHSLINQYAQLQQEEGAIRKAKDNMRQEIEAIMNPIPDGAIEKVVETDMAKATLYWASETTVNARALKELVSEEIFWNLVSVPVTIAKQVLDGQTFHVVAQVRIKDKPQLMVRAKKTEV